MLKVELSQQALDDLLRLKRYILANGGYQTTVNTLANAVEEAWSLLRENPQIGREYEYDNFYRELVITVGKKRTCIALYRYYPLENLVVIIAIKDGREEKYQIC
ncbi:MULTISPECIES: type II toxin-antitoxin system RelE/ParE family toxin [Pasteurellaceae]|uniref:Plasmid stabilization system protein ParE n=2 Tax=Pasteurellaceae TaxID=712 RepID=A0A1H7W9Z6_9PAST|nr:MULTISPECIES: type II toxin-antitoxin system RelE/ParE family toxin [Pasteurella]MBR0574576.1 type II toxin-antitoxin system RelE/ParE family toxin [Pasteurella atlantica]MDP8040429.1 type II toxin-antitoxin system RelE/ParE family toxin [Pasteurella atlantica]MDP8042595.1 type II toxin-antitoxin system RelE/ParE family toxin [Pasteurella atlantica]MDP8044710.1 type II toxin-antitoxin system RelE/ParE family toxin [Pasteurella atlantica]MDP8046758.1 type II toxin-antitoxin system RelE/ParE 